VKKMKINEKNNGKGVIALRNRLTLLIIASLLIAVFAVSAVSFASGYNTLQSRASSATVAVAQPQSGCCGVGKQGRGARLNDWAAALNLTPEEFILLRQQGKTIEQIAKDKGLDVEAVVEKIFTKDKANFDELVKAGKLTSEQAESILKFRKERLLERAQSNGKPSWAGKGRAGAGCCGGGCCNLINSSSL
jgi:hypothetical protein